MHTGKVFFFAGSGNDPTNTSTPNGSAVWDVNAGTFYQPTTPLNASGQPLDLFCAGQSFQSQGLLMVAGGTLQYDPFYGLSTALMFDPGTQQWSTRASMNFGRWYPTLVTLGSGRIFALSGLNSTGGLCVQPEVYASTFGWKAFPPTSPFPMYANLFLMSDGRLFFSGACMYGNNGVTPRILSLPAQFSKAIGETPVSGLTSADASNQATSVLLPPAQDQRVMIIGGGMPMTGSSADMAVNRVAIANLASPSPTYTTAPSLNYARMHLGAVLLPDRTVLVCNGSGIEEDTTTSMLPAEIYNPATNTWTVDATPTVPRVYHSVAFLLPDGSVVTAGGNPKRGTDELRIEIYSPWYMTQTRPVIQSAPQSVGYGATLTVNTAQAASIKWVSLIRASANTHSCDTEQRLVDVPITARTSTSLTTAVTGNRNLAPPGWYMLFITDNTGVPSVASWVLLG
ncbi:MAG TPA: galactose oxidase-like domain-containing protein [Anaerolineae bacterium]